MEVKKLFPEDQEYQEVAAYFLKSAKGKNFQLKIQGIEKTTNPSIEQKFNSNKRVYEIKYGKVKTIEAFHGTRSDNIQSILENNLDVGRSGSNCGERFGRGVNFSVLSHVASHYCSGPERVKKMILFSVLIGNIGGVQEGECLQAPYLSNEPVQYDTLARNTKIMDVIVKYHDHVFCPNYIISFTVHSLSHIEPPATPSKDFFPAFADIGL